MEAILTDFKFAQEQKRDKILNQIANIKSKLPAVILDMKLGYLQTLFEQSFNTYEQVRDHMNATNGALTNITNQTLNSINISSAKKSTRTDDGKYDFSSIIVNFSCCFGFSFIVSFRYILLMRCWSQTVN